MKRLSMLWLIGAVLLPLLISVPTHFQVLQFYRLAHHGEIVCGKVTGFEPENHRTLRYEYEVAGKRYSGSEQGSRQPASEPCRCPVHYLPSNPEISLVKDPQKAFENEAITLGLIGVLAPSFLLFVWYSRYEKFRRWVGLEHRQT